MKIQINNLLVNKKRQQGFIAFTSLIVISAVALAVATSVALMGIDSAQSSLSVSKKHNAVIITKSCAEEAMIRLRDNVNYTGGTVNFGNDSCTIGVSGTGLNRLISITTNITGPPTYQDNAVLFVKRTGNSINIVTWQNL